MSGQLSDLCIIDLVMVEKKIKRPTEKAKLIYIRKARKLCMTEKKCKEIDNRPKEIGVERERVEC